jgi:cell division protein FtsQ
MRRFKTLIQLSLILVTLVVSTFMAQHKFASDPIVNYNVRFDQGQPSIVSEKVVDKLLIQIIKDHSARLKDGIVLNKAESQIESLIGVRNAEVYTTISGLLMVDIQEKRVLAKVESDPVYYIDELGEQFVLSDPYLTELPVVRVKNDARFSGDSVKRILEKLSYFELLEADLNDLRVIADERFAIGFRSFDFEVILGDTTKLEYKLNKLMAFLIKAEQDKLLGRYHKVDLSFNNQVVATKK